MVVEDCSRKEEDIPQLLDLIPRNKEWVVSRRSHESSSLEDQKLELSLALPGQNWTHAKDTAKTNNSSRARETDPSSSSFSSLLSPGYFPSISPNLSRPFHAVTKEVSQPCCNSKKDVEFKPSSEKQPFSPSSANPAVPNTSQKRNAPAPVVGWPPVRSFRKNLASSSSAIKPSPDSQNVAPNKTSSPPSNLKQAEIQNKGRFVKINMYGVPIGRKVDLYAYNSYEKLSSAVDVLFRDLLTAQSEDKKEEMKPITDLLDGSGEYTLVYEDNEGDRMLAGDVPWIMFVATVKRLHVLKTSELSSLSLRRITKQNRRIPFVSAMI